jgi:ABC-type microcin C transport system permease subunit YejB
MFNFFFNFAFASGGAGLLGYSMTIQSHYPIIATIFAGIGAVVSLINLTLLTKELI